jgi:hypothetical protein
MLADTLEDMKLKLPPTSVDIAQVRRKYHTAVEEERQGRKAAG